MAEMKCDTGQLIKLELLYKNRPEFELKSCSDRSVGYSVWTGFSGYRFKCHSGQLSIATSRNPSVVNTICISSFSNTHVIMYRKLSLNKHGDLLRPTSEMKCDTEHMVKLEWLYKVGHEYKLNTWPDSSVGLSLLTRFSGSGLISLNPNFYSCFREPVSRGYQTYQPIMVLSCDCLQNPSTKLMWQLAKANGRN